MGRLTDLLEALAAMRKVAHVEGIADVQKEMFAEVGELVLGVYLTEPSLWAEKVESKAEKSKLSPPPPPPPPPSTNYNVTAQCRCGCERILPPRAWRGLYPSCGKAMSQWCKDNGIPGNTQESFQKWMAAGFPIPKLPELKATQKRRKHDWAAYAELTQASDRDRAVAAMIASGTKYDDVCAHFGISKPLVGQMADRMYAWSTGTEPRWARSGRPRASRSKATSDDEEYSLVPT